LTGVALGRRSHADTCIKTCNDQYAKLFDDERIRHIAAVKACQDFSDREKNLCLKEEAARHEANKQALTAAKRTCQGNCHRQGGGSAG
jgi:hypothetical protein